MTDINLNSEQLLYAGLIPCAGVSFYGAHKLYDRIASSSFEEIVLGAKKAVCVIGMVLTTCISTLSAIGFLFKARYMFDDRVIVPERSKLIGVGYLVASGACAEIGYRVAKFVYTKLS